MSHPALLAALALLTITSTACSEPSSSTPPSQPHHSARTSNNDAQSLQVIALANEGFLLRSGDQAVLIDAFLKAPYAGYDALPQPALAKLIAAQPPFDGVDLALISHEHADHVQAKPALAFLAASPDTLLATSPQALAVILEGSHGGVPSESESPDTNDDERSTKPGFSPEASSITHESHLPEPGETSFVERAGLHVEFLRLSHGVRFASIQNLGHVITIGGQRVLHVGDAAMDVRNFRPYALADRSLDVALVPYWYFLESDGRQLVDEHFRARVVIACHIPAAERDDVGRALAENYPQVLIPSAPLQVWTIEAP